MNKKMAFVGPEAYYLSFSFLGADCYCADVSNVSSVIKQLKNEGFSLIFTTEDLLSEGGDGVIVLPGMVKGSRGETIKKEIQRAVGSDISSFLNE